jgi:hypothetical protein
LAQLKERCRRRAPLRAWLAILLAASCAATAVAAVFSAEAVKAAFLYRFASYVEWPGIYDGNSFVIAVSGSDGVADQLEKLLPGKTVRGRPTTLRRVARPSELGGAHILYIGPQSLSRTRALREAAGKLPILVVTEDPKGLEAGGIINFIEQSRNVRFEVSLAAADRAQLRIDSALLAVAARVERRVSENVQ